MHVGTCTYNIYYTHSYSQKHKFLASPFHVSFIPCVTVVIGIDNSIKIGNLIQYIRIHFPEFASTFMQQKSETLYLIWTFSSGCKCKDDRYSTICSQNLNVVANLKKNRLQNITADIFLRITLGIELSIGLFSTEDYICIYTYLNLKGTRKTA